MRANVALVGFRKPPPDCRGEEFVPLPHTALFGRGLDRFRWIVLGDAVVEAYDPQRAVTPLLPLRERVVICVDVCAPAVLAAWFAAGFTRVQSADALAPFVAAPPVAADRPRVPPTEWLRVVPEPGSRCAEAIAAIPLVKPLRVGNWAAVLGWSDRKLFDVCRSALGMTPSEVITRFRVHLAQLAGEERRSVQDCTQAAEWSAASTLRRARDRLKLERRHRPSDDGEPPG